MGVLLCSHPHKIRRLGKLQNIADTVYVSRDERNLREVEPGKSVIHGVNVSVAARVPRENCPRQSLTWRARKSGRKPGMSSSVCFFSAFKLEKAYALLSQGQSLLVLKQPV